VTVFTQFKRSMNVHKDLLSVISKNDVVKLPAWDRVRGKDLIRGLKGSYSRPLKTAALASSFFTSAYPKPFLALVKSLPFLKDNFDLVHAHYAHMGARYMEIIDTLGMPMVVSLLGHDISHEAEKDGIPYSPLFEKAALLFASSEHLSGMAKEAGCPREKLMVLYPEVDVQFLEYKEREFLEGRGARLLSVCRLDWSKGLVYGLSAVRVLLDKGLKLSYRIVGEGKARDELILAIRDLGLGEVVTLAGARDRAGCRDEMQAADVFLMPSVTESFGLAAAEAQATGLPVVATRVGGLPEAVDDGSTGYLVPSRDPEALAEKIEALIKDPDLRAEFGKQARRRVEQKFEKNMIIDRLVATYEEVVKSAK